MVVNVAKLLTTELVTNYNYAIVLLNSIFIPTLLRGKHAVVCRYKKCIFSWKHICPLLVLSSCHLSIMFFHVQNLQVQIKVGSHFVLLVCYADCFKYVL